MANAVYLVVWEANTIRHGSSSSVDNVFVGEEKEAKRQATEYAQARDKRSRNRVYRAVKAKDVAYVNDKSISA